MRGVVQAYGCYDLSFSRQLGGQSAVTGRPALRSDPCALIPCAPGMGAEIPEIGKGKIGQKIGGCTLLTSRHRAFAAR